MAPRSPNPTIPARKRKREGPAECGAHKRRVIFWFSQWWPGNELMIKWVATAFAAVGFIIWTFMPPRISAW